MILLSKCFVDMVIILLNGTVHAQWRTMILEQNEGTNPGTSRATKGPDAKNEHSVCRSTRMANIFIKHNELMFSGFARQDMQQESK